MVNSISQQVRENVVTVLQGLSLTRLSSAEIMVGAVPSDDKLMRRGITVTPIQEDIDDSSPAEGTNLRDMLCYKFLLTMVLGNPHGWAENLDTIATWRQAIRRAFHNKRALTTVSATGVDHVICKVTHGQVTLAPEYAQNNNASQMVIHCWFMEPRV